MPRPRLVLKPNPSSTRLLLICGEDEVLKAVLPPPMEIHPRAAPTLCEALALWLQQPLSVVLCADAEGPSSALGLSDDLGFGVTTVHYTVEVVDPTRRPRALGSFRDLRQLELRGVK